MSGGRAVGIASEIDIGVDVTSGEVQAVAEAPVRLWAKEAYDEAGEV